MKIPFKYTMPYEDMDLLIEKGKETPEQWMVFSDRKNNRTFEQPGSYVTKKNIGFRESFVVVDEDNDYIHIFKDPNVSDKLSKDAEDYGWVNKKNMLLWRKPLYNRNDIQKKAMILNTVEAIKKSLHKGESELAKFYDDPDLKYENPNFTNIYSIFYIYKLYPDNNNPTSALLGTHTVTNEKSIQKDIWGWVQYSKLTPWDHRVAIIPNTVEKAANERKQQNTPANIFCDMETANKYKNRQNFDKECVFWNGDQYESKYIGSFFRSPVLDDIESIKIHKGLMKVGFIGNVETQNIEGQVVNMDKETYAKLQEAFSTLQNKLRNINIVFVIDGTMSMGQYFPKISEAIIQCMEKLKKTEANNRFKFAAVIYRDFNEGPRIIEPIKLSANEDEIASKLRMIEATEYNKGDDIPEAVFYGLDYAIGTINLPPNETNNIILIGDAGNHNRNDKSQVSMEQVVDQLTRFNYNFFVFQVHNQGTPPYFDFSTQTRLILEKVSENQYNKALELAEIMNETITKPSIPLPIKALDINGGIRYVDRSFIYGGIYYLHPKRRLPPDSLRERIIRNIVSINDSTNDLLRRIKDVMMGKGMEKDDPPFWNYLSKLKEIPAENLAILKSERYQIYSKGVTPQQINGSQYPLWEFQLFYDSDGIYELRQSLKSLINAQSGEEKRRLFKEAWIKLLKQHIGNLESEELENYSVGEVEKKVFGLPGTSELLSKLRLRDLDDKARLSDHEFAKWCQKIESTSRWIYTISNNPDLYKEYTFLYDIDRFYWIPQSRLP